MDVKPKHILLVDDDEVLLQVLSRALQRRHYTVSTATDSASAEVCLQQQLPDAAVLDLKLETETGLNLLPLLRAANTAMRIVVLSAYASVPTVVEAIKRGANDYLCKPAGADEILKSLFENEVVLESRAVVTANPLSVQRLEWEYIQRILHDNEGNVSATAKTLGMHRRTLQRKLAKKPVKQ